MKRRKEDEEEDDDDYEKEEMGEENEGRKEWVKNTQQV